MSAENTRAFPEALRNCPLPGDDSAVFDDGAVVPHVWSISVYDLDAVSVKVQYGGIEVTVFRATRTR